MAVFRSLLCGWFLASLIPALAAADIGPPVRPGDIDMMSTRALTMDEALAVALKQDPDLAAAQLELDTAAARRQQGALRPNPDASFEVENLSGDLPGLSASEMTFTLDQRIELGGKRSARTAFAESLISLGRWDLEAIRRDLVRDVFVTFAEGLGAQDRLRVAEETLALAGEVTASVEQKVRAGAISPVEATRAKVALAQTGIERERARRELDAARRGVALSMGLATPSFDSLAGALDTLRVLPEWGSLVTGLERNPEVARWASEAGARQAGLRAAESLRIPDRTATGGFRRLEESDENTFVAAIGLPLPLFDRNQGGIAEATIELEKAAPEARAARRRAERMLTDAVARLEIAQVTARTLRGEVIPGATAAYEQIKRGYDLGRLSYLDLLEARRSLAEARAAEIEALVDLARARAAVASLTGGMLE
jgi:cobalt-zinc-cadmium efflux system outer membrane protein